jgi:XTP/dITP diphosphohydrolase
MQNITELYFVTGNPVKFEEVSTFFAKYAPHITIKQFNVDLAEIQTLDQTAIALDKARQAWNLLKKPILVDDTCIYFEPYKDFPGTMTKFVYKSLGLEGLFKLMETGDRMNIRIVLAFMYGDNTYSIIEATTHGIFDKTHRLDLHRAEAPFDTVFIPDGAVETVDILRLKGEAEPYQYRMKALHKFIGTN